MLQMEQWCTPECQTTFVECRHKPRVFIVLGVDSIPVFTLLMNTMTTFKIYVLLEVKEEVLTT